MIRQKAIIYVRQSSGEEKGNALELQKQHCLELAEQNNFEVTGIFADPDSSGCLYPSGDESLVPLDQTFLEWLEKQTSKKSGRPGLGEVFKHLEDIDYIIVDGLTRLVYPMYGSYLQNFILQRLDQTQVKIITVKEGVITNENFRNCMIADLQSIINDNRIYIQTQKSKETMRKLRDEGVYPNMPRMFGVEYLGNHQIRVKPEYVACIRFIFAEVLKSRPYNAIIADLNEKYLELFPGKCCHPSTFKHIATQPLYCGYMRNTDKKLIPAVQMQGQEVISYDVWCEVQEILKNKRGANPKAKFRPHPFTGLMYCGHCDAKMVSGFDNGKEFYYCCAGSNALKDPGCRAARTNINLVRQSEDYTGLKESIRPLLALGLYKYLDEKKWLKSEIPKLAAYESQLADREARRLILIEVFTENGLSMAQIAKAMCKTETKTDELRSKVENIKTLAKPDPTREKFYNLCIDRFEELLNGDINDADFELLLKQSVKKIVAFANHIKIETVYGDFKLDRVMIHKYRNFPKSTWKKVSAYDNEIDMEKCLFEVTYIYAENKTRVLNVDLVKMKIYDQK